MKSKNSPKGKTLAKHESKQRLLLQNAVSRVLLESATIAEAVTEILKEIGLALEMKVGCLWLGAPGDVFSCVGVWVAEGFPAGEFGQQSKSMTFEKGKGFLGGICASGRPQWIVRIDDDDNLLRKDAALQAGLHSCVGIPIYAERNCTALLEFYSTRVGKPEDCQFEMLESVSWQIGQFIRRRQTEAALEKLKKELETSDRLKKAVLDGIAYSVISTDPNGVVNTFSSGAERLLGYKREEMIGKVCHQRFYDQAEVEKRAQELSVQLGRKVEPGFDALVALPRMGMTDEREWTYIRKDGTRVPVLISISAHHDEQGSITGFLGVAQDLTERKNARAQQEKLLAIIDHSPDFVAIADLNGTLKYLNLSARRVMGEGKQPIGFRKISEIFSPMAAKLFEETALPAALERDAWMGDSLLKTKNGPPMPVSLVLTIQRDARKVADSMCLVMRDISEYRRTEEVLRESENMVQRLVKNVNEFAALMLKPDGTVFSWNPGAERILGYSADEIIGKHFSTFYTADQREINKPVQLLEEALKSGRLEEEGWRVRKDGSRFWAHTVLIPVKNDQGELTGFSKVTSDVTERKRIEQTLQRSIREVTNLKLAMDEHAIVSVTDSQGRITYVNDRYCSISKYAREELQGQNHKIVNSGYHPKEFFRDLWMTIGAGKVWRGEVKNKAKDGGFFWVDSTIVPFIGEEGRPEQFVAINTDITKRKELEEQLIIARDQALQTSQLKSQFLANMSHEIRTPMNGVIGMNSLLMATSLTPQQRHMAELVKSSAESLMTIISDILDFSKIESGQFRIDLAETNVVSLVEDAVTLMAQRAYSKRIELNCEFIGPFNRMFEADGGRIRQVLLNLLGNALKFTDKGEVSVAVWSWEEPKDKRRLRFEVRDTGIGIPPEAQKQLFQPFVQLNQDNSRKYAGTGLGLAISRQLVDLMGGEIGVISTPGSGSTFWFELVLPVLGTRELFESRQLPAGLLAMVVDDHMTNRRILSEQIKQQGGETVTVGSGPAALEELEKMRAAGKICKLMLIDFHMPEMDGLELAKKVRALPSMSGAKLIIVSSANVDGEEEQLSQIPIDAILRKPVTSTQLRAVLLRVLSEKKQKESPLGKKNMILSESKTPNSEKQRKTSGLRLLVAEDNPTNQIVAQSVLEMVGHSVEVAVNGAQAIEKLSKGKFDGVLMDCQMPIMDGYTATRKIRTGVPGIPQKIPVIGLTAYAGAEDRQRCLAAGMDEYVSKPLHPEDLDRALARCQINGVDSAAVILNPAAPPILDWKHIEELRQLPGRKNKALLDDVLEVFSMETPERMAAFQKLCESLQWEELRQGAHKLAGSCNAVGAKAMQTASLRLEHAAATSTEHVIVPERLKELEKEWRRLQMDLKKINKE